MADQERVVKITVQAGSSEQALKQLNAELRKTETRLDRVGTKAANDVKGGFDKIGRSSGQAGIQIQQFVGQIQGGQSAMLAFSQQSADLGIVLGAPLIGAIAGISASIAGILLPSLFSAGKAMKEIEENTQNVTKNYTALNKEQKKLISQSFAIQIEKANKELEKQDKLIKKSVINLNQANRSSKIGQGSRNRGDGDSKHIIEMKKQLTAAQIAALNLRLEIEAINQQQDQLKTQKSPGSETIDKLRVLSEKEAFSAIQNNQIKLELITAESAAIISNKANELNALDTLKDNELDKFKGTAEQKLLLTEAFEQRELDIKTKFKIQETDLKDAEEKKQLAFKKAGIVTAIGLGRQLMTASQGQSKALFEASKALSLASAIASLPNAVITSFENAGGYPWGIPAAAAMAVTGASQIASIAQTKYTSKSSTATAPSGAAPSTSAGFAPQSTRNTQTENTQSNALLNELRQWNGSDLIPVEYARRIAESLAEVNRTGGF